MENECKRCGKNMIIENIKCPLCGNYCFVIIAKNKINYIVTCLICDGDLTIPYNTFNPLSKKKLILEKA